MLHKNMSRWCNQHGVNNSQSRILLYHTCIKGDQNSSVNFPQTRHPSRYPSCAPRAQSARCIKEGSDLIKNTRAAWHGCVWKCCVPHCTQWFCWSLSLLNGYFIGNINPTFSDKPTSEDRRIFDAQRPWIHWQPNLRWFPWRPPLAVRHHFRQSFCDGIGSHENVEISLEISRRFFKISLRIRHDKLTLALSVEEFLGVKVIQLKAQEGTRKYT